MNALDYLFLLFSTPSQPADPLPGLLAVHSGLDGAEVAAVTARCGSSLAACRIVAFACDAGVDFQTALGLLPRRTVTDPSYAIELVKMAGAISSIAPEDERNEAQAAANALRSHAAFEPRVLAA